MERPQEQEPPKVIVPKNSKYVPGGYTARRKNPEQLEQYIEEALEAMAENQDYEAYRAPITITSREGELIPVPSENRGTFAEQSEQDQAAPPKITQEDRDRLKELDGNFLYFI